MLSVQTLTYIHPNRELLFENLSFSVQRYDKIALIGNNGVGKSTLLKILAGLLPPKSGTISCETTPYYVPQHFGQFDDLTVADAMQVSVKLKALQSILEGEATTENLFALNDDWTIEERTRAALVFWGMSGLRFDTPMGKLSGGEKTKVLLAGTTIHQPDLVLLDEPTNHLDLQSREFLYSYIQNAVSTFMVVSHDRILLDLLHPVLEMERRKITVYGGNYSFYKEQKEVAESAILEQIAEKEKALAKARRIEREAIERKQKQDARGRRKHEKEGTSKMYMNKMKNDAEVSSAKLKSKHTEKIDSVSDNLSKSRQSLSDTRKMKLNFESSTLHTGKTLVKAEQLNYANGETALWPKPLTFMLRSGERVRITGSNGSGKTTLIRLILGELLATTGKLYRSDFNAVYIDQDYSLIKNRRTVYEQAEAFNDGALQEHEVKIRLNRFLFGRESWDKSCGSLSGGEKMRLVLCCLMISNRQPDLFVLDEPTNNLDIQNIEILTNAINSYEGTVLVVSHDLTFLKEINVSGRIEIEGEEKG